MTASPTWVPGTGGRAIARPVPRGAGSCLGKRQGPDLECEKAAR
jgi:hypothetical protein